MTKQTIPTASLREFLSLFEAETVIEDLELGDTWHPSSGFVDEEILEGRRTIGEILAFPYDFRGLSLFKCRINGLEVEFNDKTEAFEISGDDWTVYELLNQFTFKGEQNGLMLE